MPRRFNVLTPPFDYYEESNILSGTTQGQMSFYDATLGKYTPAETSELFWDDTGKVLTFGNFPITPSSAPTTNYQVANKKYVDDNAGGGGGFWSRDAINGYVYPATLTDWVGLGTPSPSEQLEITGNFGIPATTADVGQIKQDGENLLHTYGTQNIFLGKSSGNFTTSGATQTNIGIGENVLNFLTTGYRNIGIGYDALTSATTDYQNIGIGIYALSRLTGTARDNTAIGYRSQRYLQTGNYNFSLGSNSLQNNKVGSGNIAIGTFALLGNLSNYNLAIGYNSGRLLTSGNSNIFLGYTSGYRQTTNSNLLIVDNQLRADVATEATNSILYGTMAATPASQTLRINAETHISGNVGIGTASPTAKLHLKAGTATAGTAPIKLTSGTNLTTPEAGAFEFDGTDLFFTPNTTRETIAFMSDITAAAHDEVTLADSPGTYDYLTISGQAITLNQIDLTTDITGILPVANGGTGTSTAFTQGSLVFAGASGTYAQDNSNLFWDDANNRLGMGTATPSYMFDLNGASGISDLFRIASNGTDILTITDSQTTFSDPVSFASAGDVSLAHDLIFTNSTAANVNFQGPGYMQTSSAWQNLDLTLSAANEGFVVIADTLQNDVSLSTVTAGDYYGILGNTTSTGIFTADTTNIYGVYSDAAATGISTGGTVNTYGGYFGATGESTGAATTNAYGLYVNGATGADNNYSAAFMNGNVGIGTSTPNYTLTVDGQPAANGYTAFTNYSDSRLKENVAPLSGGYMDKVMQLNPVSFSYNELSGYDADTRSRIIEGFIAQELQTVFPEMVGETSINGETYLDTNLSALPIYLTKAVQEQQIDLEENTSIIDNLKLQTSENVTTLEELQVSIDSELVKVSSQLSVHSSQLSELDSQLTAQGSQIKELEDQMAQIDIELINTQLNELMDFMLAIGADEFVKLNELATGNILLDGVLEAEEVETGGLIIKVVDKTAATIGSAVICPIATYYDALSEVCETATDTDEDGMDDASGEVVSDGERVTIATTAVTQDKKVFVSPVGDTIMGWTISNIADNEGFDIIVDSPEEGVDKPMQFNWWIIGTDE